MIRPTQTDDRGVPTEAACSDCKSTWRRPQGDTHAHSLPRWGRHHVCSEELVGLRAEQSGRPVAFAEAP